MTEKEKSPKELTSAHASPRQSPGALSSRVQLYFGDASAAEARVYAELDGIGDGPPLQLTGSVSGPRCEYARTLKASVPLNELPSRSGLLAEAIVPDPCFWTSDLPFLYDARLELRQGGKVVGSDAQSLGIRPLGVRGRRVVFDGRVWVLRAVARSRVRETELAVWRSAATAMFVDDPSEELCREASRLGVLLVAQFSGDSAPLLEKLDRLARWPAVLMAVLPSDISTSTDLRAVARNLLLAAHFCDMPAKSPPAWAHAAVCEAVDINQVVRLATGCPLPVIVLRPAASQATVRHARAECDLLQRELASRGDFAGYIV